MITYGSEYVPGRRPILRPVLVRHRVHNSPLRTHTFSVKESIYICVCERLNACYVCMKMVCNRLPRRLINVNSIRIRINSGECVKLLYIYFRKQKAENF